MYARSEALNAVRGIMNTMASMKETDLYIATRHLQGGNVFKLIRSKSSGLSFNIKESIIYNLQRLHEENKLNTLKSTFLARKIGTKTLGQLQTSKDVADLELFVKEFFSVIGYSDVVQDLSLTDKELSEEVNRIVGFLNTLESIADYDEGVGEAFYSEEETGLEDFNDWVARNTDGRITKFAELLSRSDNLFRNPSVRNSKGDKFYKYHESNFAYDTVNELLRGNVPV